MLTITVGIPAFNEKETIESLLTTILCQKLDGFAIEKIIVICDGSTDGTNHLVAQMAEKDPRIELIDSREQKGKCTRLNQIYQTAQTDFLVTFDADVALADTHVIQKLVTPFANESVGLVTGNDLPATASTFAQKIVNTWYMLWFNIRKDLNKGDTVYNVHGDCTAIRSSLAKQIVYPEGITADQDYLYIWTKKLGYSLVFAKDAIIYFNTAHTLKEFFFQTTRFLTEKDGVRKYINEADEYYAIPQIYKIKKVVESWLTNPFYVSIALFIYIYLVLFAKSHDPLNKTGTWRPIASTKKRIAIQL